MPLGVVMRRAPGVTRWVPFVWKASAILPGAGPADWRELRREGEVIEYHAATLTLDLHGAETEAYVHELQARQPSIYLILRKAEGDAARTCPWQVILVTASPYEAQDYTDGSEDIVEKVAMPPGLLAWVQEFVDEFHQEETFVKRRRDKKRTDLREDGIGDVRVVQAADVYRAPASARKERLQ